MGQLTTDSEDLRTELRLGLAQIGAQMKALLQALTESTSKLTKVDQTVQTVQVQAFAVKERVTKVEKVGEATRLRAAAIDDGLAKLDHKVLILERDRGKRMEAEGAFQESINKKVAVISGTHKSNHVRKQLLQEPFDLQRSTGSQAGGGQEAKKRNLQRCLQQTDLKVGDVLTQKKTANDAYDCARRADETVNAQGAKFQELEGKMADHTSLIVELQVAATSREDELRLYRKQTSQGQEATSVLQRWRQATNTTLEQLLRTETSGSLETTVMKDQNRSKKGRQQASTLQTSNDVQSSVPSLPLSHGDRVLAQFTDGKWYAGNIHGDYPNGHFVRA
jgi:hypothetical protein